MHKERNVTYLTSSICQPSACTGPLKCSFFKIDQACRFYRIKDNPIVYSLIISLNTNNYQCFVENFSFNIIIIEPFCNYKYICVYM